MWLLCIHTFNMHARLNFHSENLHVCGWGGQEFACLSFRSVNSPSAKLKQIQCCTVIVCSDVFTLVDFLETHTMMTGRLFIVMLGLPAWQPAKTATNSTCRSCQYCCQCSMADWYINATVYSNDLADHSCQCSVGLSYVLVHSECGHTMQA